MAENEYDDNGTDVTLTVEQGQANAEQKLILMLSASEERVRVLSEALRQLLSEVMEECTLLPLNWGPFEKARKALGDSHD